MPSDLTGNRARRYLLSAPFTFSWLTVLLMTTVIQHSLSEHALNRFLQARSTNLHHLAADPLRVLFTSLLWIDGHHWWPYLPVFAIFVAPAERWLGHLRWLAVGMLAHVVSTYLSEGYLYWTIQEAMVSPRYIDARDIGVSYFVVGLVGVLTYHIVRPWRWFYLTATVATFGLAVALHLQFTPIGHACALLIGLACYPLTRNRPGPPFDPTSYLAKRFHRRCSTPVE